MLHVPSSATQAAAAVNAAPRADSSHAKTGSSSTVRYGAMSAKKRGPYESPPHQFPLLTEIPIQWRTTVATMERSSSVSLRDHAFINGPAIDSRKIGEKTN